MSNNAGIESLQSTINDEKGVDEALDSVRDAMMEEVIELDMMIRPPKGFKSVKDYEMRVAQGQVEIPAPKPVPDPRPEPEPAPAPAPAPAPESEEPFVLPNNEGGGKSLKETLEDSIAFEGLAGNEELRSELQAAIRPILQKWLTQNLQNVVNTALEDELKHCLSVLSKDNSKN